MLSRRTILRWPAAGALAASLPRISWAKPANFSSAWSEASHSAIRLAAGGPSVAKGKLAAGVELRMQTGFKTYWRDPGDAGVPPTFDWSGSENAADIKVLWPVPHRFEDGGGWSIGYAGPITLPVLVTPIDAAKRARLNLKINYAVCEKMCIPAQGAASVMLGALNPGPHDAQLDEALRRVPQRVAIKADADLVSGFAILKVALHDGAKPALAVDAAVTDANDLDLFVEGPKGSFFGKPKIKSEAPSGAAAPTRVRFIVPIEERAKDLPSWPLLLTLAAGERGVEADAMIAAPQAR